MVSRGAVGMCTSRASRDDMAEGPIPLLGCHPLKRNSAILNLAQPIVERQRAAPFTSLRAVLGDLGRNALIGSTCTPQVEANLRIIAD